MIQFRGLSSLILPFILSLSPSSAFAAQELFMVFFKKDPAIDCQNLLDEDLTSMKKFIAYEEPATETEFVRVQFMDYFDFCETKPQSEAYGVALVTLDYSSPEKRDFYLNRIQQGGRFVAVKPLIP